MALTDPQKAQIRRWLGYSLLYSQTDPVLEGQFVALAGLPDGGATEAVVVSILAELDAVVVRVKALAGHYEADKVDELRVDPTRARATLHAVGRWWVGQLSDALHMPVRRDAWSAPPVRGT